MINSIDKLFPISIGIVGQPDINCHLARELGIDGVKEISEQSFDKAALKRKGNVGTLLVTEIVTK